MSAENAAKDTDSTGPFDLEKLRELIALMESHGLTEIDLRRQDQRWKLRRGPAEAAQLMPAGGYPAGYPAGYPSGALHMAAPPSPAVATPAPATPPAPPPDDKNIVTIKSPTVGTYFEAPSPGDPPFVTPGTQVVNDAVVCIIEAMKVFNNIKAECRGTIEKIMVENGATVEFGQVLFLVKPN